MNKAGVVSEYFFSNVDTSLANYIKNNDAATLSATNFYASQIKQTTGFTGAKQAIETFNLAQKESTEKANAVASAIGQSNSNLGNYLSTVKTGANATMPAYIRSLALAKVESIGLQAVTMALNTVLSFGLTAAAQGVINLAQKLWKLVPTANHVKEAAEKITEAYVSQTNASLGKYLNSVDTGAKVSLPRYIASLVKTRAAMMVC